MTFEKSKWQTDLDSFIGIKTTFIMAGNIHDLQFDYDYSMRQCFPVSLEECLNTLLKDEYGYSRVLFYNRTEGFYNRMSPAVVEAFQKDYRDFFVEDPDTKKLNITFTQAAAAMRQAISDTRQPIAIVFDLVTSALQRPFDIPNDEREAFANLLLVSKERSFSTDPGSGKELTSTLIMVADKVNDVPSWFYLSNPFVKTLSVGKPSRGQRLTYIRQESPRSFFDFAQLPDAEQAKFCSELTNLTEGLCCAELMGFMRKCRDGAGTPVVRMRKAVNTFRYGQAENNWGDVTAECIEEAQAIMRRRIKGQDQAIDKAVSILYRAASGLTLSSGSSTSTKPKGVLFLAGPTGTGKTELAKAITEALFTDDTQMIRFDMSEFSKSQSDQRLFGAPPGYVGYESGGELTNAVREKPFSLLLFDEIEKADSSIFDKFLQVLDEGRLTDSHGETVYFGETLIVFTSNYGLSERDPFTSKNVGVIRHDTFGSYEELRAAVEDNIRNPEKSVFRPEFINRIGENFVVFNFISPAVAEEILRAKLASFARTLKAERGIELYMGWDFYRQLLDRAVGNLENGGRGVVNVLEERFLNPLSRTLFCCSVEAGDPLLLLGEAEEGQLRFDVREPQRDEGFLLADE